MARIKLVLNERRLALVAVAGPLSRNKQPVPMWMDPGGTHKAIRRLSRLPTVGPSGEEIEIPEAIYNQSENKPRQSPAGSDKHAVVDEGEVAKEEVESRDEGWGGGEEADKFVKTTHVVDGSIKQTQ